ncbi:MAG: dockerin type I repeat-containing protein [Oscillospiraceae bacterium]|nr:dockerin type I repeat-containing protein [Oscillospiraceae bacterium]
MKKAWFKGFSLVLAAVLALAVVPVSEAALGDTVIEMNRAITRESIVEMAIKLKHTGFDGAEKLEDYLNKFLRENFDEYRDEYFNDGIAFENRLSKEYIHDIYFDVIPSVKKPYRAGTLKSEPINDTLNALKMVRYLAGLPYDDLSMTNGLNTSAQHRAVLAAATGTIGHDLPKPADMEPEFYQATLNGGYDQCELMHCLSTSPRVHMPSTAGAILSLMDDDGSNNISAAGHRLEILNPNTKEFGMGYAHRFDYPRSLTIPGYGTSNFYESYYYVHTKRLLGIGAEIDTYVAWPNSGDFPVEYFNDTSYPWSLTLGADYQTPNKNDITLTLTRTRDNKKWTFDKNTLNLGENTNNYRNSSLDHLNVYGKNIVFRPNEKELGRILTDDVFKVSLSGIKTANGMSAALSYDVKFFNLGREIGKILGCVSGGENLSITDARMILQHLVGKSLLTPEQQDIADVDGKDGVTITDARLVLQKLVGKIEKFPREL